MLFDPYVSPALKLKNRIVMAPLTRSRAVDANTPNALMAEYYGQRAGAGLIVTEGTSPSPNGLGYPRIPGIFNAAQVAGWKRVTDAVHAKGAKIFVQLMHTGRVGHVANLPEGAEVVGPTDKTLPGEMYTDAKGMQPHTQPRAMTQADIDRAVQEYVTASKLAIEAGFDGVELHAANGYLLEQFLNGNVNTRTDGYGGSAEKRNRFVLDVARAVVAAIGAARVGIRVSPFGVFNDTGAFDGVEAQYVALAPRTRRAEARVPASGRPQLDGRAGSAGRVQGGPQGSVRRYVPRERRLTRASRPSRRWRRAGAISSPSAARGSPTRT